MPRPSQRERFLDAAADLVHADGVTELTYDRLVEVTGASKGGLLYHFPSKYDLVAALLEHTFDRFEAAVDARAADDTRPFAWAHAYVDASLDARVSRPELLTASLLDPDEGHELVRQCGARVASWQTRMVDDGVPKGLATAVRYACDGWWALSAMEMGPVSIDAATLAAELHDQLDQAVAVTTAAQGRS